MKKLIFAHLNINSIKNKFLEVSSILCCGYCDILALSETKLDHSFTNSQFRVDEFSLHRKDRNEHGGGVAFFVRSSIPHRIRHDMYTNETKVEYLVLETCVKGEKIFFLLIYKPPGIKNDELVQFLESLCTLCLKECKSMYVLGDLNVNMLSETHMLTDTLNVLNMRNVIIEPTCYKSIESPTLIDVILTNTPRRLAGTINVSLGISDFHNLIGAATKMGLPNVAPKTVVYRSMKNFDEAAYVGDVEQAPFSVAELFEDIDDKMWYFETLLGGIIDAHAPIKTKKVKGNRVPYMNSELRKAINVKAMLKRKFYKFKNTHTWAKYVKQRNLVTKLKRKSKLEYFNKHCNEGTRAHDRPFWKTVKPFFTSNNASNATISIQHQNSLVSEPVEVCNHFNDYFINVADDLSEPLALTNMNVNDLCDYFSSHSSINFIKLNVSQGLSHFAFKEVTVQNVMKKCQSLRSGKAPGHDKVTSKFVKVVAAQLSPSLSHIFNHSLKMSVFPETLK